MPMKTQEFPNVEDFLNKIEDLGITEISLAAMYDMRPTKGTMSVPMTSFRIIATASKPDLDVIVSYHEDIGREVSYDDAEIAKLRELARTKSDELRKRFEAAGLKVVNAMWKGIGR